MTGAGWPGPGRGPWVGLVGEGDGWRQWPMGHFPGALAVGPPGPWGLCCGGPEVQGSQTGFPHQPCAPAQFGEVQ